MDNSVNNKALYDLEERTFLFARDIRILLKSLPNTLSIIEDSKQLIRASGSVGANYREANESLSKKDFMFRMRISRKEAKECVYWLRLLIETNQIKNINEAQKLLQEAIEPKKILSSIINKST